MFNQAIILILFVSGFAGAAYSMFTFEWICRYLGKRYPKYYAGAGRPQILNGFSAIRFSKGYRILSKLIRGKTPEGFPLDKTIQNKVSNIQTATIVVFLTWFGLVFMMFRSMYSN